MTERTGAGDPERTLRLLWRETPAPSRGPRPGLTVDGVVAAAIELADAEGLAAVTMRRLARSLGVAPMSLYTYVPGKAELLDLMLDSVYARMSRPDLAGLGWRERVTAVATENRDLFRRHPWAATVSTSRPPLGPGQLAKYEHELTAFAGLGLGDVDLDAALTFVLGFVQAAARAEAEFAAAGRDTGLTEAQWWESAGPSLARLVDPAAYPTATRVGTAAGLAHGGAYHPDHAYDFGLGRVLAGLAALVSPDGVADPDPGCG
jgi:AcrR family transcriptional regulator